MYVYDAFISYRHIEPDQTFARSLCRRLEADGYKIAFDRRDFAGNQPFLKEMERCIKESQFTLSIVSPNYIDSGPCEEEAIITKVLDMMDRKRRLFPITIEKVHLPTWLFGLTGVDYTDPDPFVDPYEKLKKDLGNPI